MRRRLLPLVAIVAATLVAACSSGGAPTAPPRSVDGHTYLSTDLQGAALVPGTRIRLAFAVGRLTASGGCNTMSGAYAIDGDRLTTGGLSMTEMACDEPRMQQDQWLARLLAGVTITLDGDTLTLADGTVRLTLVDKEVATPDLPLEGTLWRLDGIVSGDAVSSVPAGVTASMRIAGGRLDLEAGCNSGGGTVEVGADTLTFGPISLTKMACPAAEMAVERAIGAVLSGTVTYAIDADMLTLDAGNAGLVLRAVTQ
jgi:heat shock protein HslJ